MPFKVYWSEQVAGYVKGLAPEPRLRLWRAIKALADWDGQESPPRICFLEDELAGYARLRAGRHRVIFRPDFERGEVRCLFAGPRSTIYELLTEIALDDLADE